MTRAAFALPLILLAAGCGPSASPPPASPPPSAAVPPSAAAPAPAPEAPGASDAAQASAGAAANASNRFFVGQWAPSAAQCKAAWIITEGGLSTPDASCWFRGLSDAPEGVTADAHCTAQGAGKDYTMKFSSAQSAKALLVEGGPFKDAGLVRCGDAPTPVEPREPGTPGGLPDDRTPISEAPFKPTSAQGAADVVQVYFASVASRDYAKAWAQLGPDLRARFGTLAAFTRKLDAYQQYAAQVGAPGAIEGAAGSLYVEVPVQVYGRRRTGEEVHQLGTATLRRVNDVPGSSAAQRSWRIAKMTVEP